MLLQYCLQTNTENTNTQYMEYIYIDLRYRVYVMTVGFKNAGYKIVIVMDLLAGFNFS